MDNSSVRVALASLVAAAAAFAWNGVWSPACATPPAQFPTAPPDNTVCYPDIGVAYHGWFEGGNCLMWIPYSGKDQAGQASASSSAVDVQFWLDYCQEGGAFNFNLKANQDCGTTSTGNNFTPPYHSRSAHVLQYFNWSTDHSAFAINSGQPAFSADVCTSNINTPTSIGHELWDPNLSESDYIHASWGSEITIGGTTGSGPTVGITIAGTTITPYSYTAGDTSTSIAAMDIAASFNANSNFNGAWYAWAANSIVEITPTSTNSTATYTLTTQVSGGATATVTLSPGSTPTNDRNFVTDGNTCNTGQALALLWMAWTTTVQAAGNTYIQGTCSSCTGTQLDQMQTVWLFDQSGPTQGGFMNCLGSNPCDTPTSPPSGWTSSEYASDSAYNSARMAVYCQATRSNGAPVVALVNGFITGLKGTYLTPNMSSYWLSNCPQVVFADLEKATIGYSHSPADYAVWGPVMNDIAYVVALPRVPGQVLPPTAFLEDYEGTPNAAVEFAHYGLEYSFCNPGRFLDKDWENNSNTAQIGRGPLSLFLVTKCLHGPITPFVAGSDQDWNNCGGNGSTGGAQVIEDTDVACGQDYNSTPVPVLAQEMNGVYYPSGIDANNHPNAFSLINSDGDLGIVINDTNSAITVKCGKAGDYLSHKYSHYLSRPSGHDADGTWSVEYLQSHDTGGITFANEFVLNAFTCSDQGTATSIPAGTVYWLVS